MSLKSPSVAPDRATAPATARPRPTLSSLGRIPHGGLIAVLILMIVFTALRADSFTTSQNLLNILRQISVTAVIAGGLTLLMTAGGMDFSMGSNAAVTTAVAAQLLSHGQSTTVTVIATLLLATLIGLVN
ncbi:ABC transporter permease, partial [Streptomyces sp. NPDC050256]